MPTPVENPAAGITHYGYANVSATAPMVADAEHAVQRRGHQDRARQEHLPDAAAPDRSPTLATTTAVHFLFQGHEAGLVVNPPVNNVNRQGAITRINLDADAAHRVTVLATQDVHGNPLPAIDGSTWYPFSQRLLLTAEFGNGPGGSGGGVWQATVGVPIAGRIARRHSRPRRLRGHPGRRRRQSLRLVEDVGWRDPGGGLERARGQQLRLSLHSEEHPQPGSTAARLQVLQVASRAHAGPILFDATSALTQDMKDLHSYGNVFATQWITIHDTGTDGSADFDANTLAKAERWHAVQAARKRRVPSR